MLHIIDFNSVILFCCWKMGNEYKHLIFNHKICTVFVSGEKHGYHPLTFGLYLDQLVRHVDPAHRCLADYFQEEIAKPFGNN